MTSYAAVLPQPPFWGCLPTPVNTARAMGGGRTVGRTAATSRAKWSLLLGSAGWYWFRADGWERKGNTAGRQQQGILSASIFSMLSLASWSRIWALNRMLTTGYYLPNLSSQFLLSHCQLHQFLCFPLAVKNKLVKLLNGTEWRQGCKTPAF